MKFKVNKKRRTVSLKNTNRGGEIYYTLDGSDPRSADNTPSQHAMRYQEPISLQKGENIVFARTINTDGNKVTWSVLSPKKLWIK